MGSRAVGAAGVVAGHFTGLHQVRAGSGAGRPS
uniref:Uncharacterized protein n=1 Tax=Zea mays TaxID=4577 RepID=B4FCZ9_MAIZE|nr:unknown [Zea mays]